MSRAQIARHTFNSQQRLIFLTCAWIEYTNRKVLAVLVCMCEACLSRLTVRGVFLKGLSTQMCTRRNIRGKSKYTLALTAQKCLGGSSIIKRMNF